jgi:DNA replication licensing factor MCM4
MEREFFAQYISYARRFIRPSIPDYVVGEFVSEYTKMRSLGNSRKTITATPRQLESMIRIAEAIAKMRLSDVVEKRDVEESVRLIKTAMQQSATDPTTGEIDMDIITTGVSSTTQERIRQIANIIKKIIVEHKEKVKQVGVNYLNLMDYVNNRAA